MNETLESRVLLADAVLVKDIIGGAESSVFLNGGALGNRLYFAANSEVSGVATGMELWVSDGTSAGTQLVKDLNPSGSSNPRGFQAGTGVMFFIAEDSAGITQAFRSDGTANGTFAVTHLTGGGISDMRAINGKLLVASGASKLWRTDASGDSAQTSLGDIQVLRFIADSGSKTYFYGYDTTDVLYSTELWSSDGTTATRVTDISPGGASGFGDDAASFAGKVWFAADDADFRDRELYTTDGTPDAQTKMNLFATGSASPKNFAVVGGTLYFTANDASGTQIWSTTGGSASRVTSLSGTSNSSFGELTSFNGSLYFASSHTGSRFLYKLVGTAAQRIGAGTDGIAAAQLTVVGSTLFFSAENGSSVASVYSTDGSTIVKVTGAVGTSPTGLINVDGTLFFSADDPTTGNELRTVTGGATSTFNLRLKIHANKQGHTNQINEGEDLTIEAITSGQEINKIYWDFGDGKLVYSGKGKKPTHHYADNFATETVKVRVKVQAADGTYYNTSTDLTVKNLKPSIKLTIPKNWVAYAPMPFQGSVIDPDVANGTLKEVTIDWGDGTTGSTAIEPDGTFGSFKIWTDRDLIGRDVRMTADDGLAKAVKRNKVRVLDVVTKADDLTAFVTLGIGAGALIGGTPGNDRINVEKRTNVNTGAQEMWMVTLFGSELFMEEDPDAYIEVWAGAGRDRVEIAPDITDRFKVFGGSENDTLRGGGGRDTIYGQGGSDSIDGRGGKNTVKQ